MKELTFDEYELLSDDEKLKYIKETGAGGRSLHDILKELDEVSESLHKKIIREESLLIKESLSCKILLNRS